jgi:hypothetical protein
MCNQLRLETQNQARTWLILGSSRTHTCACLDVYFRASADADLGLGYCLGSNLNDVFSAQLQRK